MPRDKGDFCACYWDADGKVFLLHEQTGPPSTRAYACSDDADVIVGSAVWDREMDRHVEDASEEAPRANSPARIDRISADGRTLARNQSKAVQESGKWVIRYSPLYWHIGDTPCDLRDLMRRAGLTAPSGSITIEGLSKDGLTILATGAWESWGDASWVIRLPRRIKK